MSKTNTQTIDRAAQSEKTLAEAEENLNNLQLELQGVLAGMESVQRAWETGDASVPASRLVELKAEETRLLALTSAADRAVRAAKNRLITSTPNLAMTVAKGLGKSLFGVEAFATNETPKTDGDVTEPAVYVVQRQPETQDTVRGLISGSCELVIHAPEWAEVADGRQIARTLAAAGVRLSNADMLHVNKVGTTQQASLRVTFAYAEMPVISIQMQERHAAGLGRTIASNVVDENWSVSEDQSLLSAKGTSELVSVNVNDEGIRTVVIDVHVDTNTLSPLLTVEEAAQKVAQHMQKRQGTAMADLGRVVNVDAPTIQPVTTASGRTMRHVRSRFTFQSKVA